MQTCFPDGDEGPPACVATCDWSAGCPADCDTSACPADGVPNKAEIDAYLAGGCDEGGGDDTCTTEDFHVLVSHPLGERASEEEQGAMMEQLSAGCLPCMMAAGGGNEHTCFPASDTTCTAEDLPIVVSTPPLLLPPALAPAPAPALNLRLPRPPPPPLACITRGWRWACRNRSTRHRKQSSSRWWVNCRPGAYHA